PPTTQPGVHRQGQGQRITPTPRPPRPNPHTTHNTPHTAHTLSQQHTLRTATCNITDTQRSNTTHKQTVTTKAEHNGFVTNRKRQVEKITQRSNRRSNTKRTIQLSALRHWIGLRIQPAT